MTARSASFVSKLFGGLRRSPEARLSPAEALKLMATERRDEDAISYRRRLFVEQPDLALPVLVEVRMGETFLRHAEPVHARMSFERALQLAPEDTTQAVRLRLARLAQQLAHPTEPALIEPLLADPRLDPDLRPRLARRLAFLRGDTSWDMPAIGHVAPAPWEEPPTVATVTVAAPMDLSVWHDQAAGRSQTDLAIEEALLTSLEMDAPLPESEEGILTDGPGGPSWGEPPPQRPTWNPATQRRERGGTKRAPRRRSRRAPLAPLPIIALEID
jgi:hypothetical protein